MKRIVALALVAAICVWALYAFVYRPLACNWQLNELRARTELARDTSDSYRATLAARANLADLRRIEPKCCTSVHVYVLEAENEDILDRKEDALAALRRALTVDQRPELYFNIGTLLVELGRMDEAVEAYVTSARIRPADAIPSPEAADRVQRRLRELAAARPK